MNCNKSRTLIHLRTHGDATSREESRLDRHLESCPECREYESSVTPLELESFRADLPLDENDFAAIRESVMRRMPPRQADRQLIAWPFRLAAIAAAALLLTISVYFIARPDRQDPVPEIAERGEESIPPPAVPPVEPNPPEVAPTSPEPVSTDEPIVVEKPRVAVAASSVKTDPAETPVPATRIASEQTGAIRIELQTGDPNIRIIWLASRTMTNEKTSGNAQEASS